MRYVVAVVAALSLLLAASTSFAQTPQRMMPPNMPQMAQPPPQMMPPNMPQMAQPMPMPMPSHSMPAMRAEAPVQSGGDMNKGLVALGAGLAIGLAAIGGALGQGRAAASALEGIARNPGASGKIFIPMLLALAFVESLVLYALLIAYWLQGKV